MMTNLEKLTVLGIKAFVKKNGVKKINYVGHLYPRAYVIARPSSGCIIIATPPVDAEPQIKKLNQKINSAIDYSQVCYSFCDSIKSGDWVSCAYISTSGGGKNVAIPAVGKDGKGVAR
jgi:hypothetical protein